MTLFFLRALSKGAFGVEFTYDGSENESNVNGLEYLQEQDIAVREAAKGVLLPIRSYLFWDRDVQRAALARRRLRRIAQKIVHLYTQRQQNLAPHDRPASVLAHVMGHQYKSDIHRESDINIFNFAATDTTTFTFCFLLLMEMSRNPQMKRRLQDDLAKIMPKRNTNGTFPSLTDTFGKLTKADKELLTAINGVDYLGWCIKETLRLWPVAATGPSRKLDEDLEYQGMLLPKGSFLAVNFFSLFRQGWIDRAEEYIPERWADSNPQLPQLKEMFMPFSLGKRNCIGQNMAMFQLRVIAAHFLHYYDFELIGEPDFEFFLTLKPLETRMKVTPRW
mmetsp:Transcript_10427/g.17030  ORF Transcript_10427/g.17030 Transcript_10427/m.17030 type:complete len:334 (+) Transcript_10427:630-1631(+)